MRNVEKIIDINAHIENLTCEIDVVNGDSIAKISFTNLGNGDITAIKFNACGYNSFGDIVPVNGKDNFFLILQDMVIAKNESAVELKAKLPSADVRKLDLEENQICYSDGSVVSYEGENSFVFELEQIDNQEQLNALHKLYDERAMFKLKDYYAKGWVCSCGRYNKHDKSDCSLCGKLKIHTENICSDENLRKLVEEYRISEEKDRENRAAEQKRVEKEKLKKGIIIGIVAIICIVLAYPVIHTMQISQRTTYESEIGMIRSVRGVWTYYDENDNPKYRLKIEERALTKRWVGLSSHNELELDIREWNPEEGTFLVSTGTYTVLENGNIKDEAGNEFQKIGSW